MELRRRTMRAFHIIIFISSICNAAPVFIPVISISGGEDHSLFLTNAQKVYGAGFNGNYQLGDGTNLNRIVPIEVNDGQMNTNSNYLENITQISAGFVHSLVLDSNGFVWAFGAKNAQNGYLGELGNGGNDGNSVPIKVLGGEQGTSFLSYIKAISAGRSGEHSLCLDANGFCYAFGRNREGQLGAHYPDNKNSPVKVLGGQMGTSYLQNIIAVSAGEQQSMALDSNGFVYCWGDNIYQNSTSVGRGKLGINDVVSDMCSVPAKVHGVNNVGNLQNIIAISAGWDHCMALEKIDANINCTGKVFTWGYNRDGYGGCAGGRLGNGTTHDACTPVLVLKGDMNTASGYLENIIAISAGESHCIALDSNHCVWSWGDNSYGQLGTGDGTSLVPVRVKAGLQNPSNPDAPLSNIVAISAGYWHNAAIDGNGVIFVWGAGAYGKLGIGEVVDKITTPVPLYIYDTNVYNETQHKWYKHIQPAINGANTNDVIVVYEGNYDEDIDLGGKALTLKSRDPDDESVVDNTKICRYPSSGSKAINLSNNTDSEISGFTIIGGDNGIYCSNSHLVVNRCKIEDSCDGLFAENSSNLFIDRCRIAYNGNHGIDASSGTAGITNSLIYRNGGRGIYLYSVSVADIRNNTIVYNSSDGVYINWISGGDPTISNNIILGNSGGNLRGNPSSFGNVNYNCIQGGWSGGNGNINIDPCFVNRNADNYHLQKTSPCIDKGDLNFNSSTETDIDGEDRIMDGNSDGTTIVDIGADEFYRSPADFDKNKIVNFIDYALFAQSWQTMDANKSLDDDNDVDFNDLRIFCKDWLWTPDRLSEFEDGGEEEMMQEGTEQEFESQQSMLAGEEQTPAIYLISDVNEPNSGDEVTVQVYSDASIFCMGAGITITGDANITGALSTADCNEYGWDPGWLTDPYIEDNWVYIEGVNWNGSELVGTSGVVGYIKFRYNSGQVSVAITDDYGETFDVNCAPVLLSGQALVFGPADSNEQ